MILRNWYNALTAAFTNTKITGGCVVRTGEAWDMSPATGSSVSDFMFGGPSGYSWSTSEGKTGVVLGSGNTPATIDDYKLGQIITEGLNVSITKINGNPVKLTLLVTNTSDTPITIAEIGWATHISYTYALVDRTVLDTPVTIPSGGIGKIEYEIKINLPIDEA